MRLERVAHFAISRRVQMRRFGEFDLLVEIVGDGALDGGGQRPQDGNQQSLFGMHHAENRVSVHAKTSGEGIVDESQRECWPHLMLPPAACRMAARVGW